MAKLEVRLLGELTIRIDGKPVKGLPSRKAEALLAYLISTKRPYSRDLLAEFLWDDRPQDQAMANLRSLLSGLRRKLKPFLIITRQSVAFDETCDHWLDTAELLRLVQSEQAADWKAAIDLYQADFLAGFDVRDSRGFEEWATLERERLQRAAVTALRRLVEHYLGHRLYPQGIEAAARLLALNPLSEWAHRQMMLLRARNDQRTAALQQYQACCDILTDELGIDPSPETTALYERIRAASDSRRHNLPAATTPFVGREAELEQIQAQLAKPTCRLLVLAGPGGVGKTRLALQVAAAQVGAYLNGVFFVSLTAVATLDLIVPTIANALDFNFAGPADPKTQLLNYLRAKEMLLVLDNFEHLLAGSDLLAEMVQTLPDVRLLVTSRQRLNLATAWTFDVGGMQLPVSPQAAAREVESVQLFVQAARRVQADFELTDAALPPVVRICRLLAGMPLGIELAAAWTRQLTCAEIEQEIESGIEFLQSRAGDVPERHRSLQAVFDHSWALLTTREQQLLSRLSVFRGGFTRAAAETVADASLWTLSALVDKSLLTRAENGRYQLLDSVRRFTVEKLAAAPAVQAAVQERHAAHYVALLRQNEARWQTAALAEALSVLTPEIENIRAAWHWAVGQTAVQHLGTSLRSLYYLYEARGWFQEGAGAFGWAMAALLELPSLTPPQELVYAQLGVRYGRFNIYLGQYDKARQVLTDVLPLLQTYDEAQEEALCLSYLSIVEGFQGQYDLARQRAEAAAEITAALDNRQALAFVQNLQGTLAHRLGEYETARQFYEASLAIRRELGDQYGTAVVLNNLGNLANACQEYETARRLYEESQAIFKEVNHLPGRAATLTNAGVVAWKLGELGAARQLHEESLIIKQELGNRRSIAISLINLGEVTCSMGELAESRRAFHEALRLTTGIQVTPLALDAIAGLAALLVQDGQRERAVCLLHLARNHPASTQETQDKAARLLEELGEMETAVPKLDLETAVADILKGY